jgi:hypothetical protein
MVKAGVFEKLLLVLIAAMLLNFNSGAAGRVFAQSEAAEFLCEIAVNYYKQGAIEDARHEFKKVLMIDPDNLLAQKYIRMIAQDEAISDPGKSVVLKKEILPEKSPPAREPEKIIVSGELQAGFGIESDDFIWKRANADMNEKNWRILSDDGFNRKENTFDPGIYDSLSVKVETPAQNEGLGFHAKMNIDPWAFTGKSDKITLTGSGGDKAEVQLKYWSNTGYTLNESVYTSSKGDSFNLPEIKVKDNKTAATTITSNWGNTFSIPEMKIRKEFQPFRELWVDYKQDDHLKLRVFPIAGENEAYSSDDPLGLSNRHVYWTDSPWLRRWQEGNFNSDAAPVSFTKGYWDNSISFMAKDSTGARLTGLRGFSFDLRPDEKTDFTTTWAAPKDPWQDYGEVNNLSGAARLKLSPSDNSRFGLLYTQRLGFTEDGGKTDSSNQVLAGDLAYELSPGMKFTAEVAASQSQNDKTNEEYKTKSRGNAYYVSLVNCYPQKDIIDLDYGQISAERSDTFLSKTRIFFSHMDQGFEPALADYRGTRQDSSWSRHLHFHQPLEYFYKGLYSGALNFDDIQSCAIGDGIDIGRDVVGLRWQLSLRDDFSNLFDTREVHDTDGRYLESVTRDEMTWKINDQLTAKALGLYQHLPKTKAGVDPFIYDGRTGIYLTDWSSAPIEGGLDPSLKTGSLGLEYAFTPWLKLNGVYELTNDYSLAYGNFPRGAWNSAQPSDVYYENGNAYLRNRNFLYDQHLFPQPPYDFYNVFKAGLTLIPMDKLELYFDYTRNEFEKAGQVSDSMNHFGAEIGFMPSDKLGFYLRYTYSLWQDLDKLQEGNTDPTGHHNVFAAVRYMPSKDDEFTLEYGVSPNYSYIADSQTFDPYGGNLVAIDTQHIVRFFYRKKF